MVVPFVIVTGVPSATILPNWSAIVPDKLAVAPSIMLVTSLFKVAFLATSGFTVLLTVLTASPVADFKLTATFSVIPLV